MLGKSQCCILKQTVGRIAAIQFAVKLFYRNTLYSFIQNMFVNDASLAGNKIN